LTAGESAVGSLNSNLVPSGRVRALTFAPIAASAALTARFNDGLRGLRAARSPIAQSLALNC